MNLCPQLSRFTAILCLSILSIAASPSFVVAQRPHARAAGASEPGAYNIANDVSLQGTILSYTENSKTPPNGTHVVLQTPAGNVDVHLGDAGLLHLAKMNLAPGMSVRFVGQTDNASGRPVFLARLVQVGTQLLALRSDHGLPLAPAGFRANKTLAAKVSAEQGGAR